MKKLGRPKLPKEERRSKILPIRFSNKELNELKFLQKLHKFNSLAAFVRDRLGIKYVQ